MLNLLNIAQLVLYIALLALAGQGLLYLLTGAGREHNLFYRVLGSVGRPFTALVRRLTPSKVADRHVPLLTFWLLGLCYAVVTLEKLELCRGLAMAGCR